MLQTSIWIIYTFLCFFSLNFFKTSLQFYFYVNISIRFLSYIFCLMLNRWTSYKIEKILIASSHLFFPLKKWVPITDCWLVWINMAMDTSQCVAFVTGAVGQLTHSLWEVIICSKLYYSMRIPHSQWGTTTPKSSSSMRGYFNFLKVFYGNKWISP